MDQIFRGKDNTEYLTLTILLTVQRMPRYQEVGNRRKAAMRLFWTFLSKRKYI